MGLSVHRSDLKWGYLAQALNVGSGLLLLPFVVRYLPTEQIGLWFVFITLGALAQLLEFGFQPTIARNTAYVYAGARELSSIGLPTDLAHDHQPHLPVLSELITACRHIYRWVALLVGLTLLVGGTAYIGTLIHGLEEAKNILAAWIMYASGTIVNFYFGYANGLLQGRGDVSLANKVLIASRGGLMVLGLIALVLGFGLPGLGGATLASCVIGRWFAIRYLKHDPSMQNAMATAQLESGRSTTRTLWHNASRLGVVQVNAFLIQRANVLVASSFLGLTTAASYGLTVTIFMTLSTVAMTVLQIRLPSLIRARTLDDRSGAQSIFGEVIVLSWFIYLAGLLFLLIAGNPLLVLVTGKAALLPTLPLIVLGFILALEMNHSIAATYLTTRNAVPFLWPSVFSGVATLSLSLWWVHLWEVWGLIAAQGLVQLAYNNWRWPRMARYELDASWSTLIRAGLGRLRATFQNTHF